MQLSSKLKTIAMSAAALGMMATAPQAAAEIGACLITKTDTNPFFVKMKEGALAGARANGSPIPYRMPWIHCRSAAKPNPTTPHTTRDGSAES